MKKLFILIMISITLWSFQVSAQKWVSTIPQNKNVVLEEFTGIHCGYCPDGHKRANDLYTSNPDRVVLINIHAGSFAVPSGSEPDFRTTEGDAFNTLAGVTGYPSGSVNRANSPWGQSRNLWSGLATTIMSQSSPVNVAVKSSVDLTTRILTVEVEAYYTANSPQSSNYLTVDLLQDNYLGYQSDYGNYNPSKWMGPNYRHMHILRMVLSSGGAAGEKLDTTTSGKYYYKKYQVTLPATIKNVTLYAHLLKIAAFIAESQANIYTGAEAEVEIDSLRKTDLSIKSVTIPASYCDNTINPKIEVTNKMDQVVTSFTASAYVAGSVFTKNFSGSLAKGDKTTVDFGNISLTSYGSYMYSVYGFDNINGGNLLERNWDDNDSNSTAIRIKTNAFTTINGGFDVATIPTNFAFDQSKNSAFGIITATTPGCGAKSTLGGVRYSINAAWNVSGKPGDIILGQADFTSMTDPFLSYWYAYSDDAYGGTAPVIKIYVSKDCGSTWDEISSVTCVQTGSPATHGYYYVPKSSEYIWIGKSLSAYAGKSVVIKISAIPGTDGNDLFIDEIQVAHATGISINLINNTSVSVYPNPVQALGHIAFNLTKSSNVSFSIYNSLGAKVYSSELTEYPEGDNSISFDASQFATGAYVLRLNIGTETISKVFVK